MRPNARSLSATQAAGVGQPATRAAGVIVGQADDHEVGKLALRFELARAP